MNSIIIDGDDNNNHLNGGSAPEVINGKGGNDFLFGGDGNDTLDGGAGQDLLDGGLGANTYRWGRGAGQDIIVYGNRAEMGLNLLQLGEGVAASDLRLVRQNDHLVFGIAGTDDTLTVHGFFVQETSYTGGMAWSYPISEIRFADGTRWDMLAIQTQLKLAAAPLVVLGDQDDHMGGPALDGAGGNDELVTGGAGLLIGGSGNDTLRGGWQADVLLGGSGDDSLFGGDGNDFLDGGAGNDVLDGYGGFDTYRFGYGGGQDTIAPTRDGQGDALTIDMGPAVQAGTLTILRTSPNNPDLVLELPLSGERLTVKDYFISPRQVTIHFADGSTMNKAAIDMKAFGARPVNIVTGTDAGESLYGTNMSDIVRGGGGDDNLVGGDGDDLLVGGDGNDVLDAFLGNDVVDGGAGNDRIMTGEGAAVLLFGRASGHDDVFLPRAGGSVTVVLEAGIGAADVAFARSPDGQGPDLLVAVGGQQAGIRLPAYFMPMAAGTAPAFALQFADGTLWDSTMIGNLLLTGDEGDNRLDGSTGNDRIDGRGGNDMLHGLAGNDVLLGGAGSDVLLGGEGDDTLNGGQGNDLLDDGLGNNTYVFARGDGRDMIFNNLRFPEMRYQTIAFADGIRPEEVHLQRINRGSFDDLVLTVDGAPDQEITVQGYLYNDPQYATNMQLKEIRFADGSKWDAAAISQRLGQGTVLGETMVGTEGNDVLDAMSGDDVLLGRGGSDTLIGGRGNDRLDGGAGADTYVFNLGDGRDTLLDTYQGSGVAGNIIRFGADIAPKDLQLTQRGDELDVAYGSGGDVIVLANSPVSVPAGSATIGQLQFMDGSTRSIASYLNHAPVLAKPLPDMTAARGQLFKQSLWYTFSDPDAQDTLSLTVRQTNGQPLPEWLVYDARETTLLGYAPMSPSAVYQLRVTATDGFGLQASDDFTLTLDAPNMAPYVTMSSGGATAYENISFGVRMPTFADFDVGDSFTVKVGMADGSALPSWMSLRGSDYLAANPGFEHAGTYQLAATATDKGGLSVSSNFKIVVNNVNRAPVPTQAIGTVEAAQGTPFAFVLPAKTFVDPDGDAFANKMIMADGSAWPAWLAFDAATRTLSGTPPAGTAPVLSLMLNATDNSGLASDMIFKLNVAADAPLNLSGKGEADVLNGKSAGDTLFGMAGNDQLNGFGGNDVLDGGLGTDRMAGGAGDDRYLVDASGDVVVELFGEGRDTVVASVSYTLSAHIEALTLGGTLGLAGYGNGNDNVLTGNIGNNFLAGNGGNDILQGGAGNDSLTDNGGNNLFDGGSGVDTLSGAAGNELFIGGAGNDIINPGSGIDIIAFNRGDGSDVVNPSTGLDNVISLGRGIGYADLSFKKAGADLILGTGAGEQINLKGWYTGNSHSVAALQIFIEGTSDYQPAASAPINNQKIALFNFDALATRFDQALLANPALTSWSVAPELAAVWIKGSGTTAVGGDLAQQYATAGTLANVAQVPALAIVGSAAFGDAGQALGSALSLADGSAFLM
ncbi:MAG TPA: putative Ig domain-containing protein [Telluria sp.]|jgi:Ca2+-binding RTX toxin-like protein